MGKRKRLVLCLGISIALFGGLVYLVLFSCRLKSNSFTYEIGDEISSEADDYLSCGLLIASDEAKFDLSEVNKKATGSYTATITLNDKTYSFEISIVDTTAPTITSYDTRAFAVNEEITPKMVAKIKDASGECEKYFEFDGKNLDSIVFDEPQTVDITVFAEDSSGNLSSEEISFEIGYAPIVAVDENRLLCSVDQEISKDTLLEAAAAFDVNDGVITDSIEVNDYEVSYDIPGAYSITYSVENSIGLKADLEETLFIEEADSEYISDWDESDYFWMYSECDDEVKYAVISKLCEVGYFEGQCLDEENLEGTISLLKKSLLDIHTDYDMGGEITFGSGVIYSIEPDYIYCLSVGHVMDEVGEKVTILFENYTSLDCTNIEYEQESESNEDVVFRIPTEDVPFGTLLGLKEIYFDTSVYEELYVGEKIIGYSACFFGEDDYYSTGTIYKLEDSDDSGIAQYAISSRDIQMKHGTSGTAICDLRGRLIALESGYTKLISEEYEDDGVTKTVISSTTTNTEFMVRVDNIESVYEKLKAR